jgi:hypothetical protein
MCSSFALYSGGDFVTCGDDGFLRIFSRNPAKTGSERVQQLQQELALAVRAAAERSATGPSAEEIAKAPMWEERAQHPGKSADQVSARVLGPENSSACWAFWRSCSAEMNEV